MRIYPIAETEEVTVEVDRGSTSAKQRTGGRVWLIRLRRRGKAVIINTGLAKAAAESIAQQITCILCENPSAHNGGTTDMAQRVVLVDDLDGSEGSETITYTVNGQEYEIDLSEKNAEKFHKALEPYIEKSRPVERQPVMAAPARATRRRSASSGGGSTRSDLAEVRAWAQANGHTVAERGRIKKEILDAYDESNK